MPDKVLTCSHCGETLHGLDEQQLIQTVKQHNKEKHNIPDTSEQTIRQRMKDK